MIMTKKYERLDEEFNTECFDEEDTSIIPEVVEDNQQENKKTDLKKDYEYTRANLYSIIEKGQEAINGILELAQETELPRAYEVAGQLIKNVSDATEKLIDVQKKLKDIEETKESKGPTNVTNALFVGSTAELAKLIKQQDESQKDK
jgi:predicted house-cleaning noncanonical NTP pyrophosphatase (MazG superfamily)